MRKFPIIFIFELIFFFTRSADVYPGDSSTTEILEVGIPRTGSIDPSGDKDWFRITLNAGIAYTVINEATGADTKVAIFGPSPSTALRDSDDDAVGLSAQLFFIPTTTGVYWIESSGCGTSTGSYKVAVFPASTCPASCSNEFIYFFKK